METTKPYLHCLTASLRLTAILITLKMDNNSTIKLLWILFKDLSTCIKTLIIKKQFWAKTMSSLLRSPPQRSRVMNLTSRWILYSKAIRRTKFSQPPYSVCLPIRTWWNNMTITKITLLRSIILNCSRIYWARCRISSTTNTSTIAALIISSMRQTIINYHISWAKLILNIISQETWITLTLITLFKAICRLKMTS